MISFVAASSAVILLGGSVLAADHPAVVAQDVQTSQTDSSVSGARQDALEPQPADYQSAEPVVAEATTSAAQASNQTTAVSALQSQVPAVVTPAVSPSSMVAVAAVKTTENSSSGFSVVSPKSMAGESSSDAAQSGTTTQGTVAELQTNTGFTAPDGFKERPVVAEIPMVSYGETRLPIQPVITSHSALPADLASSIPSTPVHSGEHVPGKSTGLLSVLSVGLASTLVPNSGLAPVSQPLEIVRVPVRILVIGLGLVIAYLLFGLWLRRGGLVTAPRSDVATHQSIFATPFSMGYVLVRPMRRSPFLMVSDTKIYPVTFVTQ